MTPRRQHLFLVGLLACTLPVPLRAQSSSAARDPLRFEAAGPNEFTFNTGVLRGKLRAEGKSGGLSSVVHLPTGTRLDRSVGLFGHYRIFTTNKRYGTAAWDWPSTASLGSDGSVTTIWPATDDRPFELQAVYRWAAPNVLDLETTVLAKARMPQFETFVAAYFADGFSNSLVYAEGAGANPGRGFLSAEPSLGTWLTFPRDAAAAERFGDGRWRLPPNPVDWVMMPRLVEPVGWRRSPANDLSAVVMAARTECFAVSTPQQTEPHNSMYLSLFGSELQAGQSARARARLLIDTGLTEKSILRAYDDFLRSSETPERGAADSRPRPTPQQLAWQRHELIAFAHFGMNTFTDREWGDGKEDPRQFNPTEFDARQWARVLREAGAKLLILTAKHHDGFCLWPSRFTGHSVKSSPWRGGQGDVVGEVVNALREQNLRVGIYLSPWDRNQPSYGDSPKYNEYFRNQLGELLSNYGPIDEVWFDGACGEGPNGKKQEYDWASFYALVRKLQPQALIAIAGPDIRWVGNESGVAKENESSVVLNGGRATWYPAECDVSLRPGWFYHAQEDAQVKPLATLADIYFKSVGRNAVLLLNIPPDRRGRIADADVARLREFRAYLDQLYATDFVRTATLQDAGARVLTQLTDGEPGTVWTPGQDQTSGQLEFDLGQDRTFNTARLQEDITHGERVQAYHLDALEGTQWRRLTAGGVIGQKQLRRFPTLTARRVRLVIDQAAAPPRLAEFGLHFNPLAPAGTGALTANRPATASDVHPGGTQYGPDKAVDDDPLTRWATSDGVKTAWLEVQLGGPATISRLVIKELEPRLRRFQLQYRLRPDEPWQVAIEGERAGTDFTTSFPPVQAAAVRLNILDSSRPPTLWEFQVFDR